MIQYTIHEVAALLNISTDAIRLYEKEGLVTPTRNPENGYRYYNTEQIHRIMGICLPQATCEHCRDQAPCRSVYTGRYLRWFFRFH